MSDQERFKQLIKETEAKFNFGEINPDELQLIIDCLQALEAEVAKMPDHVIVERAVAHFVERIDSLIERLDRYLGD